MYKWKLILAALLITGLSLNAGAADINVGNRLVNVPLPDGFTELTPDMSQYYGTIQAFVAPTNTRHLTLIPNAVADAMLRGELVDLERYMSIESEQGLSAASLSAAEFAELRRHYRDQVDELYATVEERLPGMLEEGNRVVSEALSADMAVDFGGMVPLPIHLDTDNAIASSLFMTVGATVNGENVGSDVLAGTSLILHVKDKVLFLYVYGPESDLEWTRETAAAWATSIVAANPFYSEEQRGAEKPDSFSGDTGRIFEIALIAALIGALIGLVSFFLRRR